MNAIQDWLLNQFVGKLVARTAVTIAGAVAGPAVQAILSKAGVTVVVDPAQLQLGMVAAAHAAYEAYKAWHQGTPAGNNAALQAIIAKAPTPAA